MHTGSLCSVPIVAYQLTLQSATLRVLPRFMQYLAVHEAQAPKQALIVRLDNSRAQSSTETISLGYNACIARMNLALDPPMNVLSVCYDLEDVDQRFKTWRALDCCSYVNPDYFPLLRLDSKTT